MAGKQAGFKRRQYYINRKFQTGFIFRFVLVLILGAVLSVVITLLTTTSTLTSSYNGARLVIEKTSWAILPSVIMTHLVSTLVVGVVAIVVTLLVSHKIAGPMFRFEKDIEEISEGNLQKKIHIRDGDQFGKVAKSLNVMVENLNKRVTEVRQELDELVEHAEEKQAPQELLEEIRSCRRGIESKFNL